MAHQHRVFRGNYNGRYSGLVTAPVLKAGYGGDSMGSNSSAFLQQYPGTQTGIAARLKSS